MNKLKKFYRNNRVVVILMSIVFICVLIILFALIKYFYVGNNTSKYGDRLEGIENVEIDDTKKSDVESKLIADDLIDTAKITIQGKIIYISMTFTDKASLVEAEGKALLSFDYFSDEEKAFYDFQFTLKQSASDTNEGFIISGAKNVNGSNLVWNNNTDDTTTN